MKSVSEQIDFLAQYVTDRRRELIDRVLESRTDRLTIVLEDVYHAQNISAALRTAECLGIQDVHLIENLHAYDVNPRIVRGATKWLNIYRYDTAMASDPSKACIQQLKEKGFTIYATSPSIDSIPLPDLKINQKAAFIFGTEFTGITESAARLADHQVTIPMKGFTESFNISVSVALILQQALQDLEKQGVDTGLSESRKQSLKLEWYKQVVKRSDLLINRFSEL